MDRLNDMDETQGSVIASGECGGRLYRAIRFFAQVTANDVALELARRFPPAASKK